MKISYTNKEKINKTSIHDSFFEGFNYDYDKRQITLSASECYYMKKRFHFKFQNVIFFSMQSCSFWHGGNSIISMYISENDLPMKQLMDIQNSNEELYEKSYLDMGIDYIPVEFQINSGDVLLIICEALDLIEEDLS